MAGLVFIGGHHRSGTTALARTLAAHPSASGFTDTGTPEDEGEHLQSVYPDSWEHGGVGRFGFAADMHLTESSPLATAASAERLREEWSVWWDTTKPCLIEKSPPNMLKMRFLQRLFPDARFILLIRNPFAVAAATLGWERPPVRPFACDRLLRHWIRCHEIALDDARHIGNLRIVRYEELVAEPQRVLEDLRRFLELEGAVPPDGIEPGHDTRRLGRWEELERSGLLGLAARRARSRHGPRIARFGYVWGHAHTAGAPRTRRRACP